MLHDVHKHPQTLLLLITYNNTAA